MNRRLVFLLIAVLAIKSTLLALDAEPSIHFRDSAVYLATAIGKWIPPNRSFVYGLLLRPIAVWPRSLAPIVIMQGALSGIASWVVGVCLIRYFASGFLVAALCSVACAVEPLQLAAERYVLTESLATFVFAIFLLAIFSYLKTNSLSLLALIQILAVLLVSLRFRFVPMAWMASVFVPLASRRAISFWQSLGQSIRGGLHKIRWLSGVRFVLVPVSISLLLSQSLLFGYRHLYSELLHTPQAYAYPADLPGAVDANGREPLPSLTNAAGRYAEYFDAEGLRRNLEFEQKQFVDALPGETEAIRVAFGIDVKGSGSTSLTKRWEDLSMLWCWFVMALPLLYPLYFVMSWRRIRVPHIVCWICALLLLIQAVAAVEYATPRYLTTLAWLEFIMIGSLVTAVIGKRQIRGRNEETIARRST